MLEKNVTVTLEKAREWYNSGNTTLKETALQAFSEKELKKFDFTKIKTIEDALYCYNKFTFFRYSDLLITINKIREISKTSAAMVMLNIVRKVLNTGYNMNLTKDNIWYPYFKLTTKDCTYYKHELKNGILERIGKITSEGATYNVLGGGAGLGGNAGLGDFDSGGDVGDASANVGFLGCATEDIAKHFGKYFGMLIMEAMYGNMIDFERSE